MTFKRATFLIYLSPLLMLLETGCESLPQRNVSAAHHVEAAPTYRPKMLAFVHQLSQPGQVSFTLASANELYGQATEAWAKLPPEDKRSQIETFQSRFVSERIQQGIPPSDADQQTRVEVHTESGKLLASATGKTIWVDPAD